MPGKKKEREAKSKSQQRLFGMVSAYQNGKLDLDNLPASLVTKIKSIADGDKKKTGDKRKKTKGITKKAAAELASTKHKGKPEKVTESTDKLIKLTKTLKFEDFINEDKSFAEANKTMHPVEDEWHYPIMKKYGFEPIDKIEQGFVRSYRYKNADGYEMSVSTGASRDHWSDENVKAYGLWSGLEPHLKGLISGLKENKRDDEYMDALKGGEAEGMTIEDVAEKHDVPVEYLEKILPDAIEIEMEHTDDPEVAARIALDHLWETPLYYDEELGLPEMEEELEDLDDDEVENIIDKVLKYGESVDEEGEDDKKVKESKKAGRGRKNKDKVKELEDKIDDTIKKKIKKFNEL